MNLKVKQKKKNHLIQKIKRINYLNLDLNIINNKDMFNSNIPQVNNTNHIQTNNFFCYTNNNNISRNKRSENDNTFKLKYKKYKLKRNITTDNYFKKNNNIININFPNSNLESHNNNSLNETSPSKYNAISYKKQNNKNIIINDKESANNKKNLIKNLSEINYSPLIFENILKHPRNNEKIDKYKYRIFLSEKKDVKMKKKIKTSILHLKEKKDITKEEENNKLHSFLRLSKSHIKIKNLNPVSTGKNEKKETSTSTNNLSEKQLKKSNSIIDNKIIVNLFTNKKKMFRQREIKISNILNIIYSENDLQFDRNYIKHVNKKDLRGLGLTHINSSPELIKKNLNSKIHLIKDRLSLIKSIVDFTYPEIIIRRSMKQTNDFIKKFKLNIIPSKFELIKYKMKENNLNNYYSSLLDIYNSK